QSGRVQREFRAEQYVQRTRGSAPPSNGWLPRVTKRERCGGLASASRARWEELRPIAGARRKTAWKARYAPRTNNPCLDCRTLKNERQRIPFARWTCDDSDVIGYAACNCPTADTNDSRPPSVKMTLQER